MSDFCSQTIATAQMILFGRARPNNKLHVKINVREVGTKTFFPVFSCSSYVGFVPVSNLLDMYCLIWRCVFLSKFLFVTDPKPKFGWRVFGGDRSPKTFEVLGDL
jgi:hypothetical protein